MLQSAIVVGQENGTWIAKSDKVKCKVWQALKSVMARQVIVEGKFITIKLSGIMVDNKLSFERYLNKICKRSNQKLHALAINSTYILQNKFKVITRALITSHFSYSFLVCIFHSSTVNENIIKF